MAAATALAAPLLATLPVAEAQAAVPRQVAGARGKSVRFHGDTDFFGWTHLNPDGGGPNLNTVGFGFGRLALVDRTISAWGLGLGYVFPRGRAILGFRTSFVVDGTGTDINDEPWDSSVRGQFVPYFRWLFLPGRRFRPFLEAHLGLGGGSNIDKDADGSRTESSTIFPVAGAGAGVHLFIIEAFSLDAGLAFDYVAPHFKGTAIDANGDRVEGNYTKTADVFNLAVQIGFSVWFG